LTKRGFEINIQTKAKQIKHSSLLEERRKMDKAIPEVNRHIMQRMR